MLWIVNLFSEWTLLWYFYYARRKIGSGVGCTRGCAGWLVISSVYPSSQQDVQQQCPYPFHIKYMESLATSHGSTGWYSRRIICDLPTENFLWGIKLIGSVIISECRIVTAWRLPLKWNQSLLMHIILPWSWNVLHIIFKKSEMSNNEKKLSG